MLMLVCVFDSVLRRFQEEHCNRGGNQQGGSLIGALKKYGEK
jgi:hypothetical protein